MQLELLPPPTLIDDPLVERMVRRMQAVQAAVQGRELLSLQHKQAVMELVLAYDRDAQQAQEQIEAATQAYQQVVSALQCKYHVDLKQYVFDDQAGTLSRA